MEAKQDPRYLENNNMDAKLMYSVQQASTILIKAKEVETKKWKVEYQYKLINTLKGFKNEYHGTVGKKRIKLSFVGRLKALFVGEVVEYLENMK